MKRRGALQNAANAVEQLFVFAVVPAPVAKYVVVVARHAVLLGQLAVQGSGAIEAGSRPRRSELQRHEQFRHLLALRLARVQQMRHAFFGGAVHAAGVERRPQARSLRRVGIQEAAVARTPFELRDFGVMKQPRNARKPVFVDRKARLAQGTNERVVANSELGRAVAACRTCQQRNKKMQLADHGRARSRRRLRLQLPHLAELSHGRLNGGERRWPTGPPRCDQRSIFSLYDPIERDEGRRGRRRSEAGVRQHRIEHRFLSVQG